MELSKRMKAPEQKGEFVQKSSFLFLGKGQGREKIYLANLLSRKYLFQFKDNEGFPCPPFSAHGIFGCLCYEVHSTEAEYFLLVKE